MTIIPNLPEKLRKMGIVVAVAKTGILTPPDFAPTEAEAAFIADVGVSIVATDEAVISGGASFVESYPLELERD